MKLKNGYLILSESISVNGVPENIKILPLGNVNSRKGNFLVDETSFKEMQQYFTDRQIDVVIDYEHQTLEGTEAPAAGWIKDLKLTDEGVVAKVYWTDRAKEYLKNKEYRYLSPVIFKRKSDGRAIVLHSVALTNTPAIDGMEPIVNNLNFLKGGKEDMNEFLKKLAVLLGLDENATEEEIIEAIKKLAENEKAPEGNEEEIVANKEILKALELDEKATVEDVKGKIIALKNPAGYVSAEDFTKLKEKIQEKESEDLVKMALSTGKITPAQKDWAKQYALKDPSGFKNFVDKAPQVVPLEELELTDKKTKSPKLNSELEISINKQLGITSEEIEKYGKDDE